MSEPSQSFRRTAFVLTASGAIPFIGLVIAMAVLDAPTNSTTGLWLQTYTAVILSFLGGIRWGMAVANPAAGQTPLVLSVLPALAGWAILPFALILTPGAEWYLGYALLFALQLIWDWNARSMPAWFREVRLMISIVVIASLAAAWLVQRFLF